MLREPRTLILPSPLTSLLADGTSDLCDLFSVSALVDTNVASLP